MFVFEREALDCGSSGVVELRGPTPPILSARELAAEVRSERLETIWTRTREHPLYAQQSTDCVRYLAEFPARRPF